MPDAEEVKKEKARKAKLKGERRVKRAEHFIVLREYRIAMAISKEKVKLLFDPKTEVMNCVFLKKNICF